jgi:glycosyltransferase involved in cell wall biosynthesis
MSQVRMPHIVYVCAAPVYGGAEEYLIGLAENVRRADWRVSALLPQRPGFAGAVARLEAAGVGVATGPIKTSEDYPWPTLLHLADVPQRAWLERTLRAYAPDVVHINQPNTEGGQLVLAAAARLAGVPVVTTVHAYDSIGALGYRLGRLRDAIVDWHYRRVRAISVPAPTAARVLQRAYRHTRGKASVVGPAIDAARFAPARAAVGAAAWRARLAPDGATRLVGVVGRLSPEKGQVALVRAWPRIVAAAPGARLVLAGEGPARGAIEALCQAAGISDSVVLLGGVAHDDVPALLGALDVVVLPSRYECLPLAILEAMAVGRPVVAYAINAIPDAIAHEESGLLVTPGDDVALAAAILRILRDPALARCLGQCARQVIETRFTAAVQTRQILDLYQRVLCAPKGAHQ